MQSAGRRTECDMNRKQIPNILSVIRLLMVPVFIAIYFSDIKNAEIWALAVFVAAELTDVLDGYLARKNGWTTEAGKILDPLADKLMQAAAIISLPSIVPPHIASTESYAEKSCVNPSRFLSDPSGNTLKLRI